MALQFHNATGRRKRSIARVFIRPGTGKFTVNNRESTEFFCNREHWLQVIKDPLNRTNCADKLDVMVTVCGGGVSGQAEAIRMGLARALVDFNISNRVILKSLGMLTRDSREVERKHYYKRKARKSPQYSKR